MHKKVFRVEQGHRACVDRPIAGITAPAAREHEIMTELKAMRAMFEQFQPPQPIVDPQQIAELQKLKTELDIIQDAIDRTKQEMATLHITGFRGPQMARVTDELDAVVGGTEKATQSILSAAEEIDQIANTLSAALKNEHDRGLTQDIQDRVIKIFEACNFQDLTGQRVSKVVSTMRFIEEHIVRMIEIWGGIDALSAFQPEAMATRDAEARLLNGPRLATDQGHASQNDIDALFN